MNLDTGQVGRQDQGLSGEVSVVHWCETRVVSAPG